LVRIAARKITATPAMEKSGIVNVPPDVLRHVFQAKQH